MPTFLLFYVESYDENEILKLRECEVRPRARSKLAWDEVICLAVLVFSLFTISNFANYNDLCFSLSKHKLKTLGRFDVQLFEI